MRLLVLIIALCGSAPAFAQRPTAPEAPLPPKQSLSPDPSLAGDVTRKVSPAPKPASGPGRELSDEQLRLKQLQRRMLLERAFGVDVQMC